jgi:tetratricopeptide (TPR) repeat protein
MGQYASPVDSLSALIKKDQNDTNKITHLNRLGWELMYENPDTSILLSKQAMELCIQLLETGEAKNNETIQKSIKKRLAQTSNCLGVFYWVTSDYSASIKYHKQALELRRLLGDRMNQGSSLNNLGLVYKSQGNYNEALKNYFAAISIAIEFGDKSLISTDLVNLGTVFHDMGEYKRALNFYQAAIPIYKELNDMVGTSMAYSYMGNAYKDMGELKKALAYYDKGVAISRDIHNPYLESFELNNTGEVYVAMKNYNKALECFQVSLPIAREIGELSLVSTILGNLGGVYFKMGDYEKSEKYLTEALDISEMIEAYPTIESNARYLSDLYAKIHEFEKAYTYQNRYIAAHDSIYNDTKTKELGQLETKHELTLEARERQMEEKFRIEKLKKTQNRRDLLQISGIVLLLMIIAFIVILLGFKKVSPKIANGITFFATLLLFEFLLVLFDPTVDLISNGQPAYKLVCNAVLALGIFPVHGFFTRLLKSRLSK